MPAVTVHVLVTMCSITCALVSASQNQGGGIDCGEGGLGGGGIRVCPGYHSLISGNVKGLWYRWTAYGLTEHFMVSWSACMD